MKSTRIIPWPASTFVLKTHWENGGNVKHFWVYLERRSSGKYGRLEVLHALVPRRKSKASLSQTIGSPSYRLNLLQGAQEVINQAGVSIAQAHAFYKTIVNEYPAPTEEELFLEQIELPIVGLMMGPRKADLSYFKTGVPKFTREDQILIQACTESMGKRMKGDKVFIAKAADTLLGRGVGDVFRRSR